EDRREEKPDAGLADAARHLFWTQIDLHAKLLEHVGRATHRGSGAVAVLGDPRPAGRRDDWGEGGDGEGGPTVAPRAARVKQCAIDLDRRRHRPSGSSETGQL